MCDLASEETSFSLSKVQRMMKKFRKIRLSGVMDLKRKEAGK